MRKESINIDITPEDVDKKYYSDFMIDFKEKYNRTYKNISDITLKINELNIIPEIKEPYNNLNIIINNQTKKIELEDGMYELEDLISGITENLEDVNIVCSIDKKGRVIIENTEDEEFEIQSDEKSFGRFLGFTEENYNGSTKYISELPSPLSRKELYLYFTNISNKPFCKINKDNNITYMHKITKPINELDCLIVQFKDINTEEDSNYHNFYGESYSIELTMNCDKN